jgi:hypothetical protein
MQPLVLLLFVLPAILHGYPQQSDRRVSSSRTLLVELIIRVQGKGARGGAVVKALRYKPEGRGIDSPEVSVVQRNSL